MWLVQCDCGNRRVVAGRSLMSGNTKACGCLNGKAERAPFAMIGRRLRRITMIGRRFGSYVVVGEGSARFRKQHYKPVYYYKVRCDCGQRREVNGSALRAGKSLSCGCLQRELSSRNRTHGDSRKYGLTAEYRCWAAIIQRCKNPKHRQWQDYGGRGINVCERWQSSYVNFLDDMGRRPSPVHSIDRINNDGNYEPSNCRWATKVEQARNRRKKKPKRRPGDAATTPERLNTAEKEPQPCH